MGNYGKKVGFTKDLLAIGNVWRMQSSLIIDAFIALLF